MDISGIIKNLQAQVQSGSKIELNNTLLSDAQVKAMATSFGLASGSLVTINGVTSVPQPVGNSVTITTGTVDILGQKDLANIQITFTGGTDTNIVFYLPMPSGWKVTDSFSKLTIFPFNVLEFSGVFFVYTTQDLTGWQVPGKSTIDLSAGLNIDGQVSLKGLGMIISLLGSQLPTTLNLAGTISADSSNPYPTMLLVADLGIPTFTLLGNLIIKNLGLLLEVAKPDENGEQAINFGITASTNNLSYNLLVLDGGDAMSINVGPATGYQATLANLATTELTTAILPGVDFSSMVPAPLASAFLNDVVLNGFTIVMSLAQPRKVTSITLSVGQASGTTISLGLFNLTGFTFNARWISPGTSGVLTTVDFAVSGKVPISIFKDDFNFRLSASKTGGNWTLDSLYAGYLGSISMADILHEISPSTEVPDFMSHVSFSNFVASAKPTDSQFTLSCMGAVDISFMDQDFVAGFVLTLDKTASTTTFKLAAQFGIGDVLFSLDIQLANSSVSGSSFSVVGTAIYSGSFSMNFTFSLSQKKATPPKTGNVYTIELKYVADVPPKMSDFLEMVATTLGLEAPFPGGVDIDAEMDALTVMIVKEGSDPVRMDMAGLFKLTVSSLEWDIYVSYTNDSYFESQGPDKRALGPDGKPAFTFGIALSGDIGLNKLPLVGQIPGVSDLNIKKLGFYYTDAAFSTTLTKLIFTVAELGTDTPLSPTPDTAFLSQPKFSLMAAFGNKDDASKPSALPLPVDTGTTPAGQPAFQKTQSQPTDPISWLNINKTFGPVNLIKVGLSYDKPDSDQAIGIVGLYLTGAFTLGGLSMVLDRLGVTFPIPKPGSGLNPLSDIGFHLGGMFLEYKGPSFEIAGGFITLPGGSVNMIGEFIVQFGTLGLQAYGGYSNQLGNPSLFLFLHINAPLGGPPFFFITGVSGGFGVNRGFKLPTFEELTTYPLLPSSPAIPESKDLAAQSPEDKLKSMTGALVGLAEYFPVEEGEYWLAAGLDVTSFEMVTVSAVLSVAFGVNLQIGVVGSASITIPVKAPEPIAFLQINFVVSYSSSSDMLAVMGAITPASYIYSGLVHLSGGFAFNTWFGGDHSGDFVLTIGGYNAHYKRPDNYPLVPRMEMRAGIGPVNMVGQAYFALVPSMLMAGLDIKATADLGPISAWFDASFDFILGWKPFHYDVSVSVEIGASFTIDVGFVKARITIHVGVFLNVWGPSFGGKAKVDLDIITFTIYFGADPQPAPLLEWSEFKQFLPSVKGDPDQSKSSAAALLGADADTNPPFVNIVINKGMTQSFEPGHEVDGLTWIIDANDFDIRTQSTAPATNLKFNDADVPLNYPFLDPTQLVAEVKKAIGEQLPQPYFAYSTPPKGLPWNQNKYGIPSMGKTNIKSTHIVNINHVDNQGNPGDAVTDVITVLKTSGVPPSLWANGPVNQSSVSDPGTVIENALVELSIIPMIWFPKRTTFIPYYYLVFDTNNLFLEQDVEPALKTPDFTPAQTQTIYQQMQNGTEFSSTQTVRASIVDLLTKVGFSQLSLVNSGQLSTQDYVDDPMLMYMSSADETHLN